METPSYSAGYGSSNAIYLLNRCIILVVWTLCSKQKRATVRMERPNKAVSGTIISHLENEIEACYRSH
jgi:hypothetical protein